MGRTMHVVLEKTQNNATANALDLCKDASQVVVAGRNVFKVYSIEEEEFVERANLRVKNANLNYSCNDVVWSPIDDTRIATAATNGAVVVWNLGRAGKSKHEQVFTDHKRTVNKVNFHPTENDRLLSGSQDGTMKLFDLRTDEGQLTFPSNTESVRDVQFNPHGYWQFSAVSETGKVQLWDIRRPDRCERQWPAHNNHVFACDWHPEIRNLLATAGRDKTIKVWDTSARGRGDKTHGLEHTIHTIGPVGRVRWRPQRADYLGSSALVVDFAVNVWDMRRPYIPFAAFNSHTDVTTDIAWRGDPHTLLSTSKDGTLYQHVFSDAVRPADKANPVGMNINSHGDLMVAHRHRPRNHQAHALPGKLRGAEIVFKKPLSQTELFRLCTSSLQLYQPQQKNYSLETVLRETAVRYRLTGTLPDLCDHNAGVARDLGKHQVALTWTLLKTLHAGSRGPDTRPVSGDMGSVAGVAEGEKTRLRSQSGSAKRAAGKAALRVEPTVQGRHVSGNTSESEEEEEEEADACQTLTQIALGQGGYALATATGDFFGESELAGLGVEHLVSLEGGGSAGQPTRMPGWGDLPSEAFEQRHEIKEGGREEDLLAGEEGEGAMQTVTVEDKTSDVVVWGVHGQDTRPSWSCGAVTAETLTWLAEQGDVQNAVSMYIALSGGRNGGAGEERVRGLVEEAILEHWWLSYMELLHRLQLFTQGNQVLTLCPLPAVNRLNLNSTIVYTSCTKCGKVLSKPGGAWWCERCRAPPARCSVCHAVVKGLFVWCQGCGHGGHVLHLQRWMKEQKSCPAGCGHKCQYN